MALLRVFFLWFCSLSLRRLALSRQWRKGLPSLRTSGRYSSPAASPVTFKAERCMRSCRSINQKQLLSWGQSCSRVSRTRTNNASSESSSQNSLRALIASECSATSTGVGAGSQRSILRGEQSGLLTRIVTTESVSLCVPMKKLTAFVELELAVRGCGRLS